MLHGDGITGLKRAVKFTAVREGFGEEVRFDLGRKVSPASQRVWKGFLAVDTTMSENAHACIQGAEKGTTWQGHLASWGPAPRPSLPRPGLGPWADHGLGCAFGAASNQYSLNICPVRIWWRQGDPDLDHPLPITSLSRCYFLSLSTDRIMKLAPQPRVCISQESFLFPCKIFVTLKQTKCLHIYHFQAWDIF